MYLKLENDDTASFYNYESNNLESTKVCFKFNPCHTIGQRMEKQRNCPIIFCFSADITENLRSFLKQFGVDMDENEVKIQFCLSQNGKIGPCTER